MSSFSSSTVDSNGIAHLLSDDLRDVRFYDVSQSRFASPDKTYTGYAASGFFYTLGSPSPELDDFKAAWATEGEGDATSERGTLDRFPARIFVVTTALEVVILDADSLDVWMRFTPLDGASAGVYGNFLGSSGAELVGAVFHEGVLAVCTGAGIRIADFRADTCYVIGTADLGSWASGTVAAGIVLRGTDEMLEVTSIDVGGTERLAQNTEGLCIDMASATLDGQVPPAVGALLAVGHPDGITVVQVVQGDLPETRVHEFALSESVANAVDDNDGDEVTPYMSDDSGTSEVWTSNGVHAGDFINADAVLTVIHEVDERDNVLVLDDDIPINTSFSYFIQRSVNALLIAPGGVLYFLNGQQSVMRVSDYDSWASINDDTSIDVWDNPSGSALLSSEVVTANAICVSNGDVYVGTDIGVFRATSEALSASGVSSAEFLYSADPAQPASYVILEGGMSDVRSVVVDPETGHLAVAATDGATTTITEIDQAIHQAFRFVSVADVVQALFAYRNADGPPDVEVA